MNDFIMKIMAALDTTGLKGEYEKVKKSIMSDPVASKITLDTSMSKHAVKELAKTVHDNLSTAFKDADMGEFKLSVKEIESIMNGSLKQAKQEQIKLDKEQARANERLSKLWQNYRKEAVEALTAPNAELANMRKYYIDLENQIQSNIKAENEQSVNLSKLWQNYRKEAVEALTAPNAELVKMKKYYNDLEKEIQSNIKTEKELYLAREQAYKKNAAINKKNQNNSFDRNILNNKVTAYLNNNSKLTSELKDKLLSLQQELKDTDNVDLSKLKYKFREIRSEAQALGFEGDTFLTKIGKNIKQFAGFLSSATVTMTAINSIRGMISNVKELDKAYVDLQQATGKTREETAELMHTYFELGEELGATAIDVSNSAADWLRQGKTIAETNELIKDSMILAKIGQIDSADATTYLTSAMKGYKVEVENVIGIVDKLSAVDMASATSVSGLAEGMAQVANNANIAGISMDKLLGYLAVIGETTGDDMSSVGNSVNSMFSRMGNIKLSRLKDYQNNGEDLSNVETVLRGLGIQLRDTNQEFRNFGEVLDETANRWTTFDGVTQRAIASSVAGTDHMESFLVLMENYGKAVEYSEVSVNSYGTAMEKFSAYSDSIEAKSERLKNSLQELSSNTLDSNWIKGFYDIANVLVTLVDKLGVFNVVIASTIGYLGMKSGILPILAGQFQLLILAQTGYTASTVSASLAQAGFLGAIKATTSALATLLLTNPVGWAILLAGGIVAANKAYDHFNVSLEEHQEKLTELKGKYDDTTTEVKSLEEQIKAVQSKMKEIEQIKPIEFVTDDEYQKLSDSNEQLNRRLTIQKELQKIAGREAEEQAINTIGAKSENSIYKTVSTQSNSGSSVAAKITRDEAIEERIAEYDRLTQVIKDLEDQQLSLDVSTKKGLKEYNKLGKEIDRLTNERDEHYKYILETSQALETESNNIIGATKDGEKYSSMINVLLDKVDNFINKVKSSDTDLSLSEEVIPNKELKYLSEYENTIDNLQGTISKLSSSMVKLSEGKLSVDEVLDLMQEFPELASYVDLSAEGFGNLEDGLKKVNSVSLNTTLDELYSIRDTLSDTDKIALDKVIEAFKKMSEETFSATDSILSISDAMEVLKSNKQLIQSVSKDMKEFKFISSDTLSSILKQYPELEVVVADYVSGIASAEDVLSSLNKAYDNDFNNYKLAVAKKKETDGTFYKEVLTNISDSVKDLASKYIEDFNNYKNMQEAKLALEKEYQKKKSILEKANEELSKPQLSLGDPLGTKQNMYQDMQQNFITGISEQIKEIDSIFDSIDAGINVSLNLSDFSKFDDGETKEFSQSIDWGTQSLQNLQKAVDDANTRLSNTSGFDAQKQAIKDLITAQNKLKTGYQTNANTSLSEFNSISGIDGYKNKIKSGTTFSKSDFSDETLYNKVKNAQDLWNNYQSSLSKVSQITNDIAQNNDKIFDLKVDKKFSDLEHSYNMGLKSEKKYYETRFEYAEKYYKDNIDYLDKWRSEQETYYKWQTEQEEKKLKETLEKYSSTIDKILKLYQKARNSINDIASNYKDGSQEQINAYAEGIKTARNEINYIEKEIKKLNNNYTKGKFVGTDEDYTKQLETLQDALENAYSSIDSYTKSLSDSIKTISSDIIDAFEDGRDRTIKSLEDERDAYADVVDAQKEILRLKEEQYKYEKSIAKQIKDISKIESRMAELQKAAQSGDRKAQAELKKLDEERSEKKEALTEDQHDREIDLTEQALDKALEDSNKLYNAEIERIKSEENAKIESLQKLYEKEQELINNSLNYTREEYKKLFEELQAEKAKYGVIESSSYISTMLDAQAKATNASRIQSVLGVQSEANKTSQDKTGLSALNKYIIDQGYKKLSKENMVALAQALGGDLVDITSVDMVGTDAIGKINKERILQKLKASKFETGGFASLAKSLGEDGLAFVKNEEPILSVEQGKQFKELVSHLRPLNNLVKLAQPNLSNLVTNNNSFPHFEFNISGTFPNGVEPALKNWSQEIAKDLTSIMRQK